MVHCGTPPVMMHLMQGMYLPIIVDAKDGWGAKADKEFVLVQSEFYANPGGTTKAGAAVIPMRADWSAATSRNPSHVVFNGRAFQYKGTPLKVDVGDRVRFFVVNAGPTLNSDFHIVGAIFDRVYPDANPDHALTGVQTYTMPAGGGVVFETVFDKNASGEGLYPFVTHSFADREKGAVGVIQVGVPKQFTTMVHLVGARPTVEFREWPTAFLKTDDSVEPTAPFSEPRRFYASACFQRNRSNPSESRADCRASTGSRRMLLRARPCLSSLA